MQIAVFSRLTLVYISFLISARTTSEISVPSCLLTWCKDSVPPTRLSWNIVWRCSANLVAISSSCTYWKNTMGTKHEERFFSSWIVSKISDDWRALLIWWRALCQGRVWTRMPNVKLQTTVKTYVISELTSVKI